MGNQSNKMGNQSSKMGNQSSKMKNINDIITGGFEIEYSNVEYDDITPPHQIQMYRDMMTIYYGLIKKVMKSVNDEFKTNEANQVTLSNYKHSDTPNYSTISDSIVSLEPPTTVTRTAPNIVYINTGEIVLNCFISGCRYMIRVFISNSNKLIIVFSGGKAAYSFSNITNIEYFRIFFDFLITIIHSNSIQEILLCGHSNGMPSATITSFFILLLQLPQSGMEAFNELYKLYIRHNLEAYNYILEKKTEYAIPAELKIYVCGTGGFPTIFYEENQFKYYYELLHGRYLHMSTTLDKNVKELLVGFFNNTLAKYKIELYINTLFIDKIIRVLIRNYLVFTDPTNFRLIREKIENILRILKNAPSDAVYTYRSFIKIISENSTFIEKTRLIMPYLNRQILPEEFDNAYVNIMSFKELSTKQEIIEEHKINYTHNWNYNDSIKLLSLFADEKFREILINTAIDSIDIVEYSLNDIRKMRLYLLTNEFYPIFDSLMTPILINELDIALVNYKFCCYDIDDGEIKFVSFSKGINMFDYPILFQGIPIRHDFDTWYSPLIFYAFNNGLLKK